jgi:hypothetical protein
LIPIQFTQLLSVVAVQAHCKQMAQKVAILHFLGLHQLVADMVR